MSYIVNPTYNDYTGQPLISFVYDDGSANQLEVVIPLHLRYNIPLTIALPVGVAAFNGYTFGLGNRIRAFLQAQEMGVAFCCHSWDHVDLTALTSAERWRQLYIAKKALEGMGFRNIDAFVAPYNAWNETIAQECAEAGYTIAMARWGSDMDQPNPLPLAEPYQPYSRYYLNRIGAQNPKTGDQVIAEIQAGITGGKWTIIMLHSLFDADDGTTYNWIKSEAVKVLDFVKSLSKTAALVANPGLAYRFIVGLGDYPS